MPIKGSRYLSGITFSNDNGREPMFCGMRPRSIGQATAVLEYRVKGGDRLDLLSLFFYNNDRKWWRILDANPWVVFGADLSLASCVGETLLIPKLIEQGGSP